MKKNKNIIFYILITIFSLALFYKLGAQYLWTDEVFSYHTAIRLLETGKNIFENGFPYERAPVFHNLLAFSMNIFGTSLFSSRIVNVIFAVLTSLLSYNLLKKENKQLALLSSIIILTANFTLAGVRETRMYTMATFMSFTLVYAFIKGFVETNKKKFINPYSVFFFILIPLSFYTHRLTIIISLPLLAYGAVLVIKELGLYKNKLTNIITVILGIITTYLLFPSILSLITSLIPDWVNTNGNYLFYPVLLARNLPFIALLIPFGIYLIFKNRYVKYNVLIILPLLFLFILVITPIKQERYIFLITPLFITSAIYTFHYLYKTLKDNKHKQKIVYIILAIIVIPHTYLYAKELNEIDTYTPTSISIQKKFEFNKLIDDLNSQDLLKATIIADYHSAYTLIENGFDVSYILINESSPDLKVSKIDKYFGIPFIYSQQILQDEISDVEIDILIVRNLYEFEYLNDINNIKDSESTETPIYFLETL